MRNHSASIKRGPVSSLRDLHNNMSLSSSAGTRAPTQVEDGNFRLSTRFLGHCPVTSPPTKQKEVTHLEALTPNLAFKNCSPKTTWDYGGFEHAPSPILLAWPCNKPFSAPNFNVAVCLASLCVEHTNLGSKTNSPPNRLERCWKQHGGTWALESEGQ